MVDDIVDSGESAAVGSGCGGVVACGREENLLKGSPHAIVGRSTVAKHYHFW
jgi:hypothetical protein